MNENQTPQTGQPEQPTAKELPGSTPATAGQTSLPAGGLSENITGALAYSFGFLTGIIFLLIDKRKFVRFHAAQSTVFFLSITVINILISFAFPYHFVFSPTQLVGLFSLIMWVIFMVKAYQGERFKLAVVGDLAEKLMAAI